MCSLYAKLGWQQNSNISRVFARQASSSNGTLVHVTRNVFLSKKSVSMPSFPRGSKFRFGFPCGEQVLLHWCCDWLRKNWVNDNIEDSHKNRDGKDQYVYNLIFTKTKACKWQVIRYYVSALHFCLRLRRYMLYWHLKKKLHTVVQTFF